MEPEAIPLDVLYEDQWVLVLDKPPGLVVHPAAGNPDGTLVNALIAHCGATLSGVGGVARPGIVHRLDKDTSGLSVVAKNDGAHAALGAMFAGRRIGKTYIALVQVDVSHPGLPFQKANVEAEALPGEQQASFTDETAWRRGIEQTFCLAAGEP